MSILGIGVDIVQLSRVARIVDKRGAARFAQRILSVEERTEWEQLQGQEQQIRFLAVRYVDDLARWKHGYLVVIASWSVKEAAYKALFPAFRPTWKDLALQKIGVKPSLYHSLGHSDLKLLCSISHDGDYVFTSVLAVK